MSANVIPNRRIDGVGSSPGGNGGQSTRSTASSDDSGLLLHGITIALALVAAIIFTLVEHNQSGHRHSHWCTMEIVVQSIVVLFGSWFARRHLMGHNAVVIPLLLFVTAMLSLVCEPIQRSFFDTGHPFEVLVMHCQSNLMLGLATCGFRTHYQRLCVLLSVFLTIFSLSHASPPGVLLLFAVYAVLAISWLVISHWQQISRHSIVGPQGRFPTSWVIAAIGLVVLVLLQTTSDGQAAIDRLRGFMPSSGGSEDYDEHAHGGVGDGDSLVAGQDEIKSFGPIEDAPFADDDKPSLYDAYDDTFDEPMKPPTQAERAISIPPEAVRELEQRLAESKQAGREFSTLRRRQDTGNGKVDDLSSHALFYLAGRTPVHLKMQTFDIFDGYEWFPTPKVDQHVRTSMQHTGDRHWFVLKPSQSLDELFGSRETHAVKVINLKGNIIPSPPQTDAISIDLVDRVDFYRAHAGGVVGMNRKNLPELTPIQLASSRLNQDELGNLLSISWVARELSDTTILPEHNDIERIRALASRWTAGLERGPQAIAAIVDQLRTGYELDREAHAAPDSEFPVGDFLLRSRRGPEYLFASAAAMLLRSQGYSTRLVGGFYARPENYQPRKRHTPVYTDDAHFWCEVQIAGNVWMTVEPSPGYEVLQPPPGIFEQLAAAGRATYGYIKEHPGQSILVLCILVAALAYRKRMLDALRTVIWRVTRPRCNRALVMQTLRLIESRFQLAGVVRPSNLTLQRWLDSFSSRFTQRSQLQNFAAIASRAAFSDRDVDGEERLFCEELVRELTFVSIRRQFDGFEKGRQS